MKKFAIILCTVLSLSCASTAFAAVTDKTVSGQRNDKTELQERDTATTNMPCFRPGDNLKFDVSGLTTGSQLTLISYRANEENPDDKTIQYIDQKEIKSATDTISYIIRDNCSDGVYMISIKNGSDGLYKLYYKVGSVNTELKTETEGVYYFTETDGDDVSVGYVGTVTLPANCTFADIGLKTVGFKFTENDEELATKWLSVENKTLDELLGDQNTANGKVETKGDTTFYFVETIYNVPSDNVSGIEAEIVTEDVKTSTSAE